MVDMDLFAAVSMRTVADLVKDPAITAIAKAYIHKLFTDPRYFHPAGYFVDNHCFDTSYNGISLYFAAWAALQAPDWPVLHKAGLTTDEPAQIWQAHDHRTGRTYFIELYSWIDADAPRMAHQLPEVMAVWEPMGPVLEEMTICEVEPL
jgi:hypothetical protein